MVFTWSPLGVRSIYLFSKVCNSTCLITLFGIDPMRAIFRLMSDDVNSAFTLSILQGSDGDRPSRVTI